MSKKIKVTPTYSSESKQIFRLGLAFTFVAFFSSTGFFSRRAVAQSDNGKAMIVGEKDTSSAEPGLSKNREALSPAQKPQVPSAPATRSPFAGNRQPAIASIELDIVRTTDGKLQIRSVNPQSVFASRVKQAQVFDNWDEIWEAIGERPDGDSATDIVEEVQAPSSGDTHKK